MDIEYFGDKSLNRKQTESKRTVESPILQETHRPEQQENKVMKIMLLAGQELKPQYMSG